MRACASRPPVRNLVVGGLTPYHGRENPLRHNRREVYRITLPSATAEEPDRWKVEVDLGIMVRTYARGEFDSDAWMKSEGGRPGERAQQPKAPTTCTRR